MAAQPRPAPPADCKSCPRLAGYRADNRQLYPDFHNAPVPSFGDPAARLLIVGMAPGVKGANRTGRPFTGDYAGDLLYSTLQTFGFASGTYDRRSDDGVSLKDCRITNAVRCVPPQNKTEPAEVKACRRYLVGELTVHPRPKLVLALGVVAHGATLSALALKQSSFRFAHGADHRLEDGTILLNSYHCSRYNTNTGRLTEAMFHDVFHLATALLG